MGIIEYRKIRILILTVREPKDRMAELKRKQYEEEII